MSRSALLLPLALLLSACGGDDAPVAEAPAAPPVTAPAPEAAPPPDGPTAAFTLHPVGDTMEYAETEIAVREGQTVTLTFENTATLEAMHHNVVVLQPGTDVDAFGMAAMGAADTDYIPSDPAGSIVAATSMSAPGETVSVTFDAPAPGVYPYVCTFPGHYVTMRGTLRVVEA